MARCFMASACADLLVWAVGALVEGLGITRSPVLEVDRTRCCMVGGGRGAAPGLFPIFLHDVRVTQVQLDELFARQGSQGWCGRRGRSLKAGERSPHWVWVAIDPVTKLLLTIDIGDRT